VINSTKYYEMSPADNVLYFPNNIDVRLCPKNGMSSLKELHRLNRGVDEYIGRIDRIRKVREQGDQFDIPFRKGSYRIAVRRDPIVRFRSACEYIVANQAEYIKQGRIDELPSMDEELDVVLDKIEAGTLKNNHFYTQSWYMGKPEDYDMVVYIDELSRLMVFLNDAADLGFDEETLNIHDNKSQLKVYNSILTDRQRQRIKTLYRKDYDNGWCKIEDRT
jgi:hypothetical protein